MGIDCRGSRGCDSDGEVVVLLMSVITITSNERGRDWQLDASKFPTCCGLRPFAYRWPKQKLISVMCSNRKCKNHDGVLAADCDIEMKWKKFARATANA